MRETITLNSGASRQGSQFWIATGIVFLTLLAPALGGSTELWAQAVISLGAGLLLILWPPRTSLGLFPDLCLVAVVLIGLAAFLPAHWFGPPQWRTDLSRLNVHLPGTLSPQPWLTFESSCLLWLGLAWVYYLLTFEWNSNLRDKAWMAFCFGILFLAAAMAFAFAAHTRVPFWPEARGFGFFPNRNQTGNVLSLGGIMLYAIGMRRWQEGRKNWWLWLMSLSLVFWALIINFSRAGIVLFFAGATAWHLWWLASSKERRRPVIMLVALVFLGGVLAWNGSDTLARFTRETDEFFSVTQNGRFSIYHDTFEFFKESPVAGIGLGNFRSLFSAHRRFFISPSEAIHPESDWLWVATEMGGFVPLLLFAGIAFWLWNCFPLQPGSRRGIRVAAMICGILFALHGFLDVSGHRLGSLWPALFLASTAINPQLHFWQARAIPVIFRALGGFFIIIGLWWLSSIFSSKTLPTTVTLDRLLAQIETADTAENYNEVIALADKGLIISPLNWVLYYQRGRAQVALYRNRAGIERDFAVARYLLPNWPDLSLKEGLVWLSVGEEDLAFGLWEDAMRRWPENAVALYQQIFGAIHGDVELRDRWLQLGHIDRRCLPTLLRSVNHLEFAVELERLLAEDPDLRSFTPAELQTLFDIWFQQGDQLALAEALKENPEWQKIAWRKLALVLANYGDHHQAYETAARFVPRAKLPRLDSREPIESLRQRFQKSGDIENDGLAIVLSQIDAGDLDRALTSLKTLAAMPKAPPSVYFLESELWARKSQWPKAWEAMLKYEKAIE